MMEVYSKDETKASSGSQLQVVVVHDEFVKLTDNGQPGLKLEGLVLGQMDFWQLRTKDKDQYIAEELERLGRGVIEVEPEDVRFGWVYKSADQLAGELLIGASARSVLRRFDQLVERGWLLRRRNPKLGWDRTYQYRLNLVKIKYDLEAIGLPPECWTVQPAKSMLARWVREAARKEQREDAGDSPDDFDHEELFDLLDDIENAEHLPSDTVADAPDTRTEIEHPIRHSGEWNEHGVQSNGHGGEWNRHGGEAIPENTHRLPSEETTENLSTDSLIYAVDHEEKDFEGTVREENVKPDSSSSRSLEKETLQSWPVGTPPDVLEAYGHKNFGQAMMERLSELIVGEGHGKAINLTPKQRTSCENQFNELASDGVEYDALTEAVDMAAGLWGSFGGKSVSMAIEYVEEVNRMKSQVMERENAAPAQT